MAWSVTINGHTWTNAHFDGQGYVDNWPSFWADMAAVAAGIAAAAGAGPAYIAPVTIGTGSSAALTITSSSADALTVGRQGATNPVLQVSPSIASCVTGIQIIGRALAGGVDVNVISSGTNENLSFSAKGSGTITLNSFGTGVVTTARIMTITNNTASTTAANGALIVTGGAGIGGALNVAGDLTIKKATALLAIDATSGSAGLYLYSNSAEKWHIYNDAAASHALRVYNAGFTAGVTIGQADTSWSALSDIRIKDEVEALSVLDSLNDFRAVRYVNKLSGKIEIGVVAQEELKRRPEFVRPGIQSDDDDSPIMSPDDLRLHSVIYDRYGAEALMGVKELRDECRARLAKLEQARAA